MNQVNDPLFIIEPSHIGTMYIIKITQVEEVDKKREWSEESDKA